MVTAYGVTVGGEGYNMEISSCSHGYCLWCYCRRRRIQYGMQLKLMILIDCSV